MKKGLAVFTALLLISPILFATNVSSLLDLYNIRDDLRGSYTQTTNINLAPTNPANVAAWESGTSYSVDEYVRYNDGGIVYTYICIQATSSENPTNTDYWKKLWASACGWLPLGDGTTQFSGTFNGNGFTIDDLYINRSSNLNGLFGATNGATITNTEVTNVDITGNDYVGGLVGDCVNTDITKSYTTGSLTGNDRIGGLVGDSRTGSSISLSYSSCSVSGVSRIGGFVGLNYNASSIENCYCRGSVERTSGNSAYYGGFAGINNEATIKKCYSTGEVIPNSTGKGFVGAVAASTGNYKMLDNFWDRETSKQTTSAGSTNNNSELPADKYTYQMQDTYTFTDAGWDFEGESTNGTNNYWDQFPKTNDGYPYLSWEDGSNVSLQKPFGAGTSVSPYIIANLNNLFWLSQNQGEWDKYYSQSNNIDASDTENWYDGEGFKPIGRWEAEKFTGNYDGNNKTIDGLHINREVYYLGLFGRTYTGAEISNLGITNVYIRGTTADQGLGALIGSAFETTIDNCYSSGSIQGSNNMGGLVGSLDRDNNSASVTNCHSSCTVSGDDYLGGLIGLNYGSISNSYSTGNVSGVTTEDNGSYAIGGFIGSNLNDETPSQSVTNCYCTGNVESVKGGKCGGFVGLASQNSIINKCYCTGSVDAYDDFAGGFVGDIGFEGVENAVISECYSLGNTNADNYIGSFAGRLRYSVTISNCYSKGNVVRNFGSTDTDVGGFIGYIGTGTDTNPCTVEYCYCIGTVTYATSKENPTDKGFVGSEDGASHIYTSNFFDLGTSNQTSDAVGAATGKSTSDMKTQLTFTDAGWDFSDTWSINAGFNSGYPYLQDNNTLPVELSTFTAQFINKTPTLYWRTQSELDNLGWYVYRSQIEDFNTASQVSDFISGYGTTTLTHDYTYEDYISNPQQNETYYYWLESVDLGGTIHHYAQVAELTINDNNDPGNGQIPEPIVYGLQQNTPNPFNPDLSSTTIQFSLPEQSQVKLELFNLKGQKMITLFDGFEQQSSLTWNGHNSAGKSLQNGVYLMKLMVNGHQYDTKKVLIVK